MAGAKQQKSIKINGILNRKKVRLELYTTCMQVPGHCNKTVPSLMPSVGVWGCVFLQLTHSLIDTHTHTLSRYF